MTVLPVIITQTALLATLNLILEFSTLQAKDASQKEDTSMPILQSQLNVLLTVPPACLLANV